ncbi:YoaK family protein [Brevundimonas pishanensis]|uniref:YoaK family protein n=1 Tax=Brevundimonas pishanensis TaxID=2896315 RepID=UPI001FA7F9D3|nr:YoaK family protein [Brevundimonas pishanensis]
MVRLDRPSQVLAVCFAVVAGFVDAVGFLITGGFFVSFMTGNTTRLAIGLSEISHDALVAGGLLLAFVLGVVTGASVGRLAGRYKRPAIMGWVLLALLAALVAYVKVGVVWSVVPLALAMGAQNTVFADDGEVMVGTTYMTGNLVKMGERITVALFGGDRWSWVPFFLLWAGLAGGAVLGALSYQNFGVWALALAATAMLSLALYSLFRLRA